MANLTTIRSKAGVPFTVNAQYAPRFQSLIDGLEAAGYPLNPQQSGGYNPRNIAGTNTPSQHAFGNAVDVNWDQNPRGGQSNLDPALARDIAKNYGLTWGGNWSNPDPMHFQADPNWTPPQQGGSIAAGGAPGAFPPPMALGGPTQPAQAQTAPLQGQTPMPPRGILSPPQIPNEDDYASQLKGILGNLGANSGWQALTQFGANLAGAPNWSSGISGGLKGANEAVQGGQNQRMTLLEQLSQMQARQQALALQKAQLDQQAKTNAYNPDYQGAQLELLKAQTLAERQKAAQAQLQSGLINNLLNPQASPPAAPGSGPAPGPSSSIPGAPQVASQPGAPPPAVATGQPGALPAPGDATAANGAMMPSMQSTPGYYTDEDRQNMALGLLAPRALQAIQQSPGHLVRTEQAKQVGKELGQLEERQRAGRQILQTLGQLGETANNPDIEGAIGPYNTMPGAQTLKSLVPGNKSYDLNNRLNHDIEGLVTSYISSASRSGMTMSDKRQEAFKNTMGAMMGATTKAEFDKIMHDATNIISNTFNIPPEEAAAHVAAGAGRINPQAPTQATQPAPSPTPKGLPVGSVLKGYRFKGGDPSDKNSWEKI